ncbi:MG2 domain-containing protein [Halodesulfovibrio sp.]|jgi:uncharacterized protein YfaS (alpha-2-macroglobulin family)|uniref:alpha-2-macroglobulin family protein n=1 Tax=Halodesulfovibrio sp. TaxID=1912772 RepID=UPI0025EF1F50|nr:MG2 domain-containing protein [Halodesulfovibrio sp.]MCT4627895.1 MG2 domain-containing protein [Halodesulfovibrio sp.]
MVIHTPRSTLFFTVALFFLLAFTLPATTTASNNASRFDVKIIGNGPLVPRSANQAIPITFKNLEAVDIEILKVTNPRAFLKSYYLSDALREYSLDYMQNNFESVFSDRYHLPEGKKDQITPAQLPIPKSLASGWYIVVIKAPGTFTKAEIRHMLLTDIGIQLRSYKEQTGVYVTRLSTGEALPNMNVTVARESAPLTAVTDEDGWAMVSDKIEQYDVVIVQSADESEYAILPKREIPLDLSEYSIGGRKYQAYEAYIYSNRDLLRPGGSLPINILLRNEDGCAIADTSASLQILNPYGDVVSTKKLSSDRAGYCATTVNTAADWLTGRYTARLSLFEGEVIAGEMKFQVEEFVPERMDLVITDNKKWVPVGEENIFNLTGRYLFGSPAAGNELSTTVVTTPVRHFSVGAYKDYYVGEPFSLSNAQRLSEFNRKLSEQGELAFPVASPKATEVEYKSPVNVTVNFSLKESGGAAVQRNRSFNSWKKQNIPAILPAAKTFSYNSMAEFDIALLSPNGQQLEKGELDVELFYDDGPYYWTYEEGIGWKRQAQERWKSVAKQLMTITEKPERLALPVRWGDYRLVVTDKKTGISSSCSFYAGWNQNSSRLKTKPDFLTITPDKKSYMAGEPLKVAVASPLKGTLLLTVETSDKVLWKHSQSVAKENVAVEIPLSMDKLSRHDIYITGTITGVKDTTPRRYFGVQHVKLDRSEKQLGISISLPERIEPMTKLTLPVSVSGVEKAQLKNTWVTASIVDKGIINLSRFKPQDPHAFLFGQRRYMTDIQDLFSRQYDNRPNPFARSRFGSDNNMLTQNKNDNLVESKTVILMSKAVQLIDGKAQIEFDIPDYNGEGQIIVTAYNGTQVGQLVTDSTITSPVVVELSMPRFFVPTDTSTVTIDLFNNSGKKQLCNLNLHSSSNLTLETNLLPEKLELNDGEHWTKSIPVHVHNEMTSKSSSLSVQLSTEEFSFDRSWRVPVKALEPPITKSVTGYLLEGDSYSVPASLWRGLKKATEREGTIHISTTPTLSIKEHAEHLFRYPYGCAEQTTSKAWPFLLQHSVLEPLKQKVIAEKHGVKDSRDVIAAAIARLSTMQKTNGGFGLWDSESSEAPWLTAYVSDFLLEADKLYPNTVPEPMLRKALNRLQDYVADSSVVRNLEHHADDSAVATAYAAYVLSQQGKIRYSALQQLRSNYPTALSKLHYAYACVKVGESSETIQKLFSEFLERPIRPKEYIHDYGSDIRDLACAVRIMNNFESYPQLTRQASLLQKELLSQLQRKLLSRRWFSTQEQVTLLQAAIISKNEQQKQNINIVINGTPVNKQGNITIPLSEDLNIENTSDEALYLQVMAKGYLDIAPSSKLNITRYNTINLQSLRHFSAKLNSSSTEQRLSEWLDGKDLEQEPLNNSFNVGDRVLVVLETTLGEEILKDALLVSGIPAGFVLENPNLNQGIPLQDNLPKEIIKRLSQPNHVEYRNDRFVVSDTMQGYAYRYAYVLRAEVPGKYAVPPVFLESMYNPERRYLQWQQPTRVTIKK